MARYRRGLATIAVSALGLTWGVPATAAEPNLVLVSPSDPVPDNGTVHLVFDASGFSPQAIVKVAVHPKLGSDDSDVTRSLAGTFVGTPFRPVFEAPIAAVRDVDGRTELFLPTSVVPQPGSLQLVSAGIYPIRVAIESAGRVVDELTTFVTRFSSATNRPLDVAVVFSVDSPVTLSSTGAIALRPETLVRIRVVVEWAQRWPQLPITVVVRPDILRALRSSADIETRSLVDRIIDIGARGEFLADTEVRIDPTVAAASNLSDEYRRQFVLGKTYLDSVISGRVANDSIRFIDNALDDAGLDLVTSTGAKRIVSRNRHLTSPGPGVRVVPGTTNTQIVTVDDLELAQPDFHASSEFTTRLSQRAFAAPSRGVVLGITDSTVVDPAFLDDVASQLVVLGRGGAGIIELSSISQWFTQVEPTGESATFASRSTPVQSDVGTQLALVRLDIEQLSGIAGRDPGATEAFLTAAASTDLSPLERDAFLTSAKAPWAPLRDVIDPITPARITLTNGRTDIPMTVRASTNETLKVRLRVSSDRAKFPMNEQQITIADGVWQGVIAIDAREGRYPIKIEVLPPIGENALRSGQLDIRVFALSGLGPLLSGFFIALLVTWWVAHVRRVRRSRHTAMVHPVEAMEAVGEPLTSEA